MRRKWHFGQEQEAAQSTEVNRRHWIPGDDRCTGKRENEREKEMLYSCLVTTFNSHN